MTFREIEKILKANNWLLIRTGNLTCQYQKAGIPYTIIVPNHSDKELTTGIVKDLEKKTGLSLRR
ncbi:MAG: type II toxin-antitoxin system HicA family toxin [Lachnospiraceae bacterium]|nr:type II toxin-antitoxin system HicA family toxin [Lachnospiraceae bacterium]